MKNFLLLIITSACVLLSCSQNKNGQQTTVNTNSDTTDTTEAWADDTTDSFPELSIEYLESIKSTHRLCDKSTDHILFAQSLGLKSPYFSDQDFLNAKDSLIKNNILIKLENNKYFRVKELEHSHPYLTNEAVELLYEIGYRFHDNLKKRGQREYAFYVSSALRTDESQKSLRRKNKNATIVNMSSHLYGTTFDISYLDFHRNCDSTDVQYLVIRRILTQTIREMRKDLCGLVMKENKQMCFHITVVQ